MTSEVKWSMGRPEGAVELRGGMVDGAPGGRSRAQRSNGRWGARRGRSTSEVEWSMGRPEGVIDLRGEVQGEY